MADQPKPRASADDRIAQVVTKPWFRKTAPKILPPLHRGMKRLTRGRFVPGAGLVLTTVGAKTGARHETPLEAVPCPDGTWVIVGSNFAREHHPAWTTNLIATPTPRSSSAAARWPCTPTCCRATNVTRPGAERSRTSAGGTPTPN